MQKKFVVLAAALMAWATTALAATPSQPVYKVTAPYVKIAEGENNVIGGKSLVVDGTTVYSINMTSGDSSPELPRTPELKITRSFDGGLTWNASETITKFVGNGNDGYGLKVTNDAVFPGQKLIHTIWGQQSDTSESGIFYKYFSTQTGTWSNKISVNSTITTDSGAGFSVDGNGSVHAFFGATDENANWSLYYATATTAGSPFTYPEQIASSIYTSDSAVDKQNNILVTFTGGDGNAYFMKKLAGHSDWSTPVLASTGDGLGNYYTSCITSFDASTIYILHQAWSKLVLAKSIDGGKNWTTRNIALAPANMAFGGNSPSIVVNPNNKTLTVAAELDNWVESSFQNSNVYVYRSLDGSYWSTPKIYPDLEHPSLAIDAAGKSYLTMGNSKRDLKPSLSDGFLNPRSVFFTKE